MSVDELRPFIPINPDPPTHRPYFQTFEIVSFSIDESIMSKAGYSVSKEFKSWEGEYSDECYSSHDSTEVYSPSELTKWYVYPLTPRTHHRQRRHCRRRHCRHHTCNHDPSVLAAPPAS